jgi:hypothetical protein
MHATILQEAGFRYSRDISHPQQAVIQVGVGQWTSPYPRNSGEAEAINKDAKAIVEALKTVTR